MNVLLKQTIFIAFGILTYGSQGFGVQAQHHSNFKKVAPQESVDLISATVNCDIEENSGLEGELYCHLRETYRDGPTVEDGLLFIPSGREYYEAVKNICIDHGYDYHYDRKKSFLGFTYYRTHRYQDTSEILGGLGRYRNNKLTETSLVTIVRGNLQVKRLYVYELDQAIGASSYNCLLYTSPSPRD